MTSSNQSSPHPIVNKGSRESDCLQQPGSDRVGQRSKFTQKSGALLFFMLLATLYFSALAYAADETPPDGDTAHTAERVTPGGNTAAAAAFDIIDTDPAPSAFAGVTLTNTVSATFNGDLNTDTIAANVLIRGSQQGRFNGTFQYDNGAKKFIFTPDRPFAFGESISVIGTAQVRSTGNDPLTPHQWEFMAGYREKRCIQGFTEVSDFVPVWQSSTEWGDMDRDGDLDIIIAGESLGNPVTNIYRNDNGQFTKINAGIVGVSAAAIALGDYDNDYDLDVLVTGLDPVGNAVTRIYRNDGPTTFTNINAPLIPVSLGDANWVDYDNDGRLDVFVHGDSSFGITTRLYHNDGNNQFNEVSTNFPGVNNSSSDWADYDGDGDPDLLLTGTQGTSFVSEIYRNDNGLFTAIGAGLQPVGDSAVIWNDFDGDGDEDILLTGETSQTTPTPISRVYRNDNGVFTIAANLSGVLDGAVATSDFDNDGDIDFVISGKDHTEQVKTILYENRGGTFVVYPANLPAINLGALAWGDFDGDYDADLMITGFSVSSSAVIASAAMGSSIVTGLYRNTDCPSDVFIEQTVVPTTVVSSQPVTITLNFGNLGIVTATKVLIRDIIPSGINVTGVTSSASNGSIQIVDSGKVPAYEWRVSDLLVGDSGTITITGEVNPTPGVVFTNTARISAAKDITFTNNTVTQTIVVPFRVIATSPSGGDKVSTPLDEPAALTFEVAIQPNSVTPQSLRLYGSNSGYLGHVDGNYDAGTRTYQVWGERDFVQGEVVTVIGTKQIRSGPGAPLIPYQWQFVAGDDINRCVGDFIIQSTTLPDLDNGSVDWGDYDNDGDPDLLIAGNGNGIISRIYRNNGNGLFTDIGAPLSGVRDGVVRWVDYDADGDLDAFLTGSNGANRIANLYQNNGGSFAAVSTGFTAVTDSAAAWADYDNDGYLDLLLTGQADSGRVTRLYRNQGNGTFTGINTGLPALSNGAVAWADYDNDGYLDLALTGDSDGGRVTAIFHNDGGSFTAGGIALTAVNASAMAWGDIDKDGDPDLIVIGDDGSGGNTTLYRNDSGVFNPVATGLPGVSNGTVAWGDYDNDGLLDLLLTGSTAGGPVATIYRQLNGAFTALDAGLTGATASSAAWGDYDDDQDLDLILLGHDGNTAHTQLYRNTDCISDLSIVKSVSQTTAEAGDILTYTIVFTNAGPQPAVNVVISDDLPLDLTNVQVISQPIGSGVHITDTGAAVGKKWLVSDLAVNEGGIITLTAEVLPGNPGEVFYNWLMIEATHDITDTNNWSEAGVARPFHITATVPSAAKVGFPLGGAPQAIFDADMADYTGSDRTFLVYGDQSGLRSGFVTYDIISRTLTYIPSAPFHQGEAIHLIGTSALRSLDDAPLQPYQWHFVAGAVDPERCLAGFTQMTNPFTALTKSSAAWADYDQDGDLDLLLIGSSDGANRFTKLYRNDGNHHFSEIPTTLPALHSGAVAWGDYDQDGDPDIALSGSGSGGPLAAIYRNDAGTFVNLNAPLTGVTNSAMAWGDIDNDGDLDLIVTGSTNGSAGLSRLYRNDGGAFVAVTTTLPNLQRGSVEWGDYDQDGYLDLLLAGTTDGTTALTRIYRNDNRGGFADSNANLPGIFDGDAAWSDYDGDGDLDLFLAGLTTGGGRVARLVRYDGGVSYTDVTGSNGFVAVSQAAVDWGDYDNDGDPDLLIAGTTNGSTPSLQVMTNQGNGTFTPYTHTFDGVYGGAARWVDYDGDSALDLLLTGTGSAGNTLRLYRSRDCISDLGPPNGSAQAVCCPAMR
ncbi:MAG: FG-GAP-like repeat-containing protein [Caldilineaceae bacterium]